MRHGGRRIVIVAILAGLLWTSAPPTRARLASSDRGVHVPSLAATAERIVSMGMPREIVNHYLAAPEEVARETYVNAMRAGDLNGDGSDDVFSIRIEYSITVDPDALLGPSFRTSGTSHIIALNGRTGNVLWQKRYDDLVHPLRARVGRRAKPGAIFVAGLQSFMGPLEDRYLVLDARAGKTGKRLWRSRFRTLMARSDVGAVANNVPLSLGLFNGLEGPATDVVVGVGDQGGTYAAWTTISRAVVIDGANGKQTEHLERHLGINWSPTPDPVGDLDGDGLDDYAITQDKGLSTGQGQEPPSFGGMILARKGTDGTEIFSEDGFEFFFVAWTYNLGDVTGDNIPDLGIMTSEIDEDALFIGALCLCQVKFMHYLVDGTGSKRWKRLGGWPMSPGDIDEDGRDDVVAGDFIWKSNKGIIKRWHHAHTAAGRRLWRREITTRYDTSLCKFCSSGFGAGWWQVGDTLSDRREETYVSIGIFQDGPAEDKEVAYLTDGKTGRRTISGDGGFHALGGSMDGHGTDLAYIDIQGDRILLTGRSGKERLLWSSALEVTSLRDVYTWAERADLDGDRCTDVLITANAGEQAFIAAVDGGSGRIRWWRMVKGVIDATPAHIEDRNPAC